MVRIGSCDKEGITLSNMQYLIITGDTSISDKSVVSEEAAVTSRWWETAEHKRSRF